MIRGVSDASFSPDNPLPRPQVVAIGFDDELDAALDQVAPMCGSLHRFVNWEHCLANASESEVDIVVAAQALSIEGPVGPFPQSPFASAHVAFWTDGGFTDDFCTTEFSIVNVTETTMERRSDLDVFGNAIEQLYRHFKMSPPQTGIYQSAEPMGAYTWLLRTPDHDLVAVYDRATVGDTLSIGIRIPRAGNLQLWFAAFLTHLHGDFPEAVPHAPPKLGVPEDWYVPAETELVAKIAAVEQAIAEQEADLDRLKVEFRETSQAADAEERRVLYAQGDELVAGVQNTLMAIGFEVENQDEQTEEGAPKREDLHFWLPTAPEDVGIIEVKGSKRGLATNDSRQINEQTVNFAAAHGRPPWRVWWIVNPNCTSDPSTRPATSADASKVAATIQATILAVPDLYRLHQDVLHERRSAGEARQLLLDVGHGAWAYDGSAS